MKTVIQRLKARKEQLDNSRFSFLMKNENIPAHDRMAFAPSMLYFVMGFRDMLSSLKDESDTSDFQRTVNIHCDEDSTHWIWYLQDIRLLSKMSLIDPFATSPDAVWSEDNWPIRNMVYEVIHRCKQITSPFQRLVVIQVLEATFDAFNDAIDLPVRELGLYKKLAYFGKAHLDAEEDHAFDDWLKVDVDAYSKTIQVSQEELGKAIFLIDELFDSFEMMFDNWYAKSERNFAPLVAAS